MKISVCCHVVLWDLQFECLPPLYACFSRLFNETVCVCVYITVVVIVSTLIGLTSGSDEVWWMYVIHRESESLM